MNFTVATHNSLTKVDGYEHYDNVEFEDIPDMVTSGFNYVACKLQNGIRKDDNFDGFVDVLILDIDDSCTIEQAREIFKAYKFYLITSKSHQKEKNGFVCDRFRMFLKLDCTINIRQQMEEIYNQVIFKYPFIDKSCRNVSRSYYSSPKDALVIYNEGRMYPTIILSGVESKNNAKEYQDKGKGKNEHIEHLNEVFVFNEITELWTNKYGEVLECESTNVESKIKGALTVLDNEFYSGNRNNVIFKVCAMLRKDGLDENYIIEFLTRENDKRDGLKFGELMQVIRSAFRL